jgi:hypothetical protein
VALCTCVSAAKSTIPTAEPIEVDSSLFFTLVDKDSINHPTQ